MAKERALSVEATEILEFVRASESALTLADIKVAFPKANSSHLTALANRNLVSADKIEKEVITVTKRKVNSYTFVPQEVEAE